MAYFSRSFFLAEVAWRMTVHEKLKNTRVYWDKHYSIYRLYLKLDFAVILFSTISN